MFELMVVIHYSVVFQHQLHQPVVAVVALENVILIMELDKENQVDLVVVELVFMGLNLKMDLVVLQVEQEIHLL